ncbi:MAG: hypothetical protein DBP02_10110 [gamma proteobacterium symbiont of Ctena orbiculata]|nr:MAG: hypothetical protein DBP02_10110 [gamma proteobacterium symbiont of Ctena orbiculata]
MYKEITVAVIAGIIVSIASYLLIIKENQMSITALQNEVKQLREMEMKTQTSLNATKLFIASAHPDKDISKLASIKKLQKLNKNELEVLAEGINRERMLSMRAKFIKDPEELKRITIMMDDTIKLMEELRKNHQLSTEDISTYAAITKMPLQEVPQL